jgi:hypothetical protein
MLQLSQVVHAERLQEAARLRHLNETGTTRSNLSERLLPGLGQALISLGHKLKAQSQSGSTTSTSHIG